jgi:hypothetical protein
MHRNGYEQRSCMINHVPLGVSVLVLHAQALLAAAAFLYACQRVS